MDLYRRRIERDLERWREKGWVAPDALSAIRADLDTRSSSVRLGDVLALLGAVLFCLAAAAFVAANWTEIPRPGKLGLLVGLLWAAYAAAGVLKARGATIAAHAAALLGCGLFGADIMLISQMYHISGEPTGALLVWAIGALLAGVLLGSAPVLVGAAGLFALWSEWHAFTTFQVHWPVLIAWAALAAAYRFIGWRGGFHIIALGLLGFVFGLGFRFGGFGSEMFLPTAAIGLVAMGVGWLIDLTPEMAERFDHRGRAVTVYGFIAAFSGLFFWQVLTHDGAKGLADFGPYAAVGLAFLIATLGLASARQHATLLWWTYAALVAELVMLYLRTLGTLLETAVFFLIAGGLVAAMAWLASVIRKPSPPGSATHGGGAEEGATS